MDDEGQSVAKFPQKRYFRQRAHANPFSDHSMDYPLTPEKFNVAELYPTCGLSHQISILDVGCGYGGFLVKLSTLYPESLSLGLEIRTKLVEYVKQRITALRAKNQCKNAQVVRTNAMKFLPNYFKKGQLEKIFFLFPDPHFKRKKHKARIITGQLLSEYAYFLKPSGQLYIATDVKELFDYMSSTIEKHHLFKRIDDKDIPADLSDSILHSTEESMKVERKGGEKFLAGYLRL